MISTSMSAILCLSESPNSILMWSHYADQYQGAVISFDADHQFFVDQIGVKYVTERPKIPIETYTSGPIPLSELCNKSQEWQYEQEVRIARLLTECKKTNQGRRQRIPGIYSRLASGFHREHCTRRKNSYRTAERDIRAC